MFSTSFSSPTQVNFNSPITNNTPSFNPNSLNDKTAVSEHHPCCMPVTIRLLKLSISNPSSVISSSPDTTSTPSQGVLIHSQPTALVNLCGWVVSFQTLRSQRKIWISDGTGKILVQYSLIAQQDFEISFKEGDLVNVVGVFIHTNTKQEEPLEDSDYIAASSVKLVQDPKEYVEFAPVEVIHAATDLLYSSNRQSNQKTDEINDDRKRKLETENFDSIDLPSIYDAIDSDIEKDIIRFMTINPTISCDKLLSALSFRYEGESLLEAVEHLKLMDLVVSDGSTLQLVF